MMHKGHINICKIYSDGTTETVVDRANMLTTGMISSFLDIQQGLGSQDSLVYRPGYFQLGTSTLDVDVSLATSSSYYRLSAPFDWTDYGEDTDLLLYNRYRGLYASSTDPTGVAPGWTEIFGTSAVVSATLFSGVDEYFAKVTDAKVTKYFLDGFEAQIVLDENTANGKDITEIGLFARNPKGFKEDTPLLMAYRSFAALTKTSDYSLVIRWSIGFLGVNNAIDPHYTGDTATVVPMGWIAPQAPGYSGKGAGSSAGGGQGGDQYYSQGDHCPPDCGWKDEPQLDDICHPPGGWAKLGEIADKAAHLLAEMAVGKIAGAQGGIIEAGYKLTKFIDFTEDKELQCAITDIFKRKSNVVPEEESFGQGFVQGPPLPPGGMGPANP